jgi:outer membrane protein assembly factor BamB
MRKFVLTAALLVNLASHDAAQNRATWPGLWGPTRNGESASAAPASLDAATELWRRKSAGGYSEVAVADGRAITMELRDGADYVVAFDADTGRERWAARIGSTYKGHGGSDDGPIATPAIDRDLVFAAGPHGVLIALDAASGAERWRHDLVRDFGATLATWGFAYSPLVVDGRVLIATGGPKSRGLLAFDRATGRLAWSAGHARSEGYSSPVLATLAGTRQVVVAAGDRVFGVSPDQGALLWSIAGLGADKAIANAPIVLPGDRVLYGDWGESVMLRITKQGSAFSAAEAWRSSRLRAYNGPAIYRDGMLFSFVGPMLVCADAATGEITWRERIGEGTLVGAGPRLLVLGQTSGDLRLVRAAAGGYAELSRARVFTPEVRSVTGPSLAGNRLYLRNLREIAAYRIPDP